MSNYLKDFFLAFWAFWCRSSARSPLESCTSPLSFRSPLLSKPPDPGSWNIPSWILDPQSSIPTRVADVLNQVRSEFLEQQPIEEIMPKSDLKRKTDCKTNFWQIQAIASSLRLEVVWLEFQQQSSFANQTCRASLIISDRRKPLLAEVIKPVQWLRRVTKQFESCDKKCFSSHMTGKVVRSDTAS